MGSTISSKRLKLFWPRTRIVPMFARYLWDSLICLRHIESGFEMFPLWRRRWRRAVPLAIEIMDLGRELGSAWAVLGRLLEGGVVERTGLEKKTLLLSFARMPVDGGASRRGSGGGLKIDHVGSRS